MADISTIASEKERLYESSSLRDDLNDDEATVLLKWGEGQVERLASEFPAEFEQKARYLRQLIKNINRFVGQREFNEMDGQQKYMQKVVQYLEPLGWSGMGEDAFFSVLPEDKADMAANLDAMLKVLTPAEETEEPSPDDAPTAIVLDDTPTAIVPDNTSTNIGLDDTVPDHPVNELEKSNEHSINQSDMTFEVEEEWDYGEE